VFFCSFPSIEEEEKPDKKKTRNLFKEKERRGCMEEEKEKRSADAGSEKTLISEFRESVCSGEDGLN